MSKRLLFLFVSILFSIQTFSKSDSIPLPAPTGDFAIGTMTYFWTDESREISYSSFEGDKRTVVVQLWYPSEKDHKAQVAPYASTNADYALVQTHSFLYAPFKKDLNNTPLILFIPGIGIERFAYTSIIEDLASNGFVVASIDMPEIGYLLLSDGKEIKTSERFEAPDGLMSGPYEKVDEFYQSAVELASQDLQFVIKNLNMLNNSDPSGRFKGKINLNNIGIFGHSLGGRIAGEMTANFNNIKAYASMEGIPPRKVRFEGKIKIPSLMLCSTGTWYYAENNYKDFIENSSSTVHMIELVDFGHNSITDGPILFPRSYKYAIDPFRALEISRKLLLDFFNEELRQQGEFGKDLGSYLKVRYNIFE